MLSSREFAFSPPSCYSIIEVLSEERGESLWRGEEEESDSGTHTVRTRRGGGEAGLGWGPSLPPRGREEEEEEEERPYDLTFCDCARDWERSSLSCAAVLLSPIICIVVRRNHLASRIRLADI